MVYLPLTIIGYKRGMLSVCACTKESKLDWGFTEWPNYWVEISTLWRASLGLCPAPVELHARFAVLQLAHGDSLSQRI